MYSQTKLKKYKDPLDKLISIQLESTNRVTPNRVSTLSLPMIQGSSRQQIKSIMKTFDQGTFKLRKDINTQSQAVIPSTQQLRGVSVLDNSISTSLLEKKQIKPKSYKTIFEDQVQRCGNAAIIHNLQSVTAADSSLVFDGSQKRRKKNDNQRKLLTQKKLANNLSQRLEKEFGYHNDSINHRNSIFQAKSTTPIHAKMYGLPGHGHIMLKRQSPQREIPRKQKKNLQSISQLGVYSSDRNVKSLKFDVGSVRQVATGSYKTTDRTILDSYRTNDQPILIPSSQGFNQEEKSKKRQKSHEHPDEIHQIQSNYVSLGRHQNEQKKYFAENKPYRNADINVEPPSVEPKKVVNNPNYEYFATFSQMKHQSSEESSAKMTPVEMDTKILLLDNKNIIDADTPRMREEKKEKKDFFNQKRVQSHSFQTPTRMTDENRLQMMSRSKKIPMPVIEVPEKQVMVRNKKIPAPAVTQMPEKPTERIKKIESNKKIPVVAPKVLKPMQLYANKHMSAKKSRAVKISPSNSDSEELGLKKASVFKKLQITSTIDEPQINFEERSLIFDKALGSSSQSPSRCLKFMTETDELYTGRMLPYIDGVPNKVFETTQDSTFDMDEQSASLFAKIINVGLSEFTMRQNHSNSQLIQTVKMKEMMNIQDTGPQELNDTQFNFKMIKNTNKEIKQLVQATSKVVCDIQKFHTLIPILDKHVDQAPVLKQSTFDLCKNMQYSLKIPVKGRFSPLKLKLEFLHNNEKISKASFLMLKNTIDIHYSKYHFNPQPTGPSDTAPRCEKSFIGGEPPRIILIHSNFKNIPLIPFQNDFVYVTLDCKDQELLEEITLCVKATIQEPPQKKKRVNQDDEFEEPSKNSKNSLIEFKLDTMDQVESMINNRHLFEEFQSKLKKPAFITQKDDQEFENQRSSSLLQDKDVLKQYIEFGNFIGHNKMAVKVNKYDFISKQQKYSQLNNEQNMKAQFALKRKQENDWEHHKMKIFLIHRQEILREFKQEKIKESQAKLILKKKVESIIKLIKMQQIVRFVLYQNYQNLRDRIITKKRIMACARQISRHFHRAVRKKAKDYETRRRLEIRQVFTLNVQFLQFKNASDIKYMILDLLKNTSEVQNIVDKVISYSKTISRLQTIYRHFRNVEKFRVIALTKQSEYVKKQQINNLLKAQAGKNKERLQRIMTLSKDTMKEICRDYYNIQKLKFQVQNLFLLEPQIEQKISSFQRKIQQMENETNSESDFELEYNDIPKQMSLDKMKFYIKFMQNFQLSMQDHLNKKIEKCYQLQQKLNLANEIPPADPKKKPQKKTLKETAAEKGIESESSKLKWIVDHQLMKKFIELGINSQEMQLQKKRESQQVNEKQEEAPSKSKAENEKKKKKK